MKFVQTFIFKYYSKKPTVLKIFTMSEFKIERTNCIENIYSLDFKLIWIKYEWILFNINKIWMSLYQKKMVQLKQVKIMFSEFVHIITVIYWFRFWFWNWNNAHVRFSYFFIRKSFFNRQYYLFFLMWTHKKIIICKWI